MVHHQILEDTEHLHSTFRPAFLRAVYPSASTPQSIQLASGRVCGRLDRVVGQHPRLDRPLGVVVRRAQGI